MDDEVYISISFPKVTREKADEIVKAATKVAGHIPYNVYYDEPVQPEEENVTDG